MVNFLKKIIDDFFLSNVKSISEHAYRKLVRAGLVSGGALLFYVLGLLFVFIAGFSEKFFVKVIFISVACAYTLAAYSAFDLIFFVRSFRKFFIDFFERITLIKKKNAILYELVILYDDVIEEHIEMCQRLAEEIGDKGLVKALTTMNRERIIFQRGENNRLVTELSEVNAKLSAYTGKSGKGFEPDIALGKTGQVLAALFEGQQGHYEFFSELNKKKRDTLN